MQILLVNIGTTHSNRSAYRARKIPTEERIFNVVIVAVAIFSMIIAGVCSVNVTNVLAMRRIVQIISTR